VIKCLHATGALIVAVYYASAIDDATSTSVYDSQFGCYVSIAIAATLAAGILPLLYVRRTREPLHLRGLRRYVLLSVVACLATYLMMSVYVEDQASDWVAPRWLGFVLSVALSLLVGWSVAYGDARMAAANARSAPGRKAGRHRGNRRSRSDATFPWPVPLVTARVAGVVDGYDLDSAPHHEAAAGTAVWLSEDHDNQRHNRAPPQLCERPYHYNSPDA
jgi:hypothetical protein